MIFLDANIVLDVLLHRPRAEKAAALLNTLGESPASVSMLSVHLIVYFGQRAGIPLIKIFDVIDHMIVVDTTAADYAWAKTNMRNADFEDALQLGAAIRSGCHELYTGDIRFYEAYKSLPQIRVKLVQ